MARTGEWHIDTLTIENFRCFEHLEMDFHRSLTLLVGMNGAGKTSILDAVAVAMSTVLREFDGPKRRFALQDAREIPNELKSGDTGARMATVYPVSSTVQGTVAGKEYLWGRALRSAKGNTTASGRDIALSFDLAEIWAASEVPGDGSSLLPVVAFYGVGRLAAPRPETSRRAAGSASARTRSVAYEDALDGEAGLARLSGFVADLTMAGIVAERSGEPDRAATNQLHAVTLACNAILQETGWQNPEATPGPGEIAFTHEVHGTLPLSLLSRGIRITAGLVIDLVSRMARANPNLGGQQLLDSVPGIVMIDEVELHLHPTCQQRIILGLQELFPRIQFIVTTNSPQVLSTVDADCIRVLDGGQIRRVEFSAGLRSDKVLEQILGTRAEPPLAINRKLDDYMELVGVGLGESLEARQLRQSLDEELGGITNVVKLADADAMIAFYDLDD